MPDLQRRRRPGVAALVCGRRTKWLVVALWLIVLVVAAPLAQKLTGAQACVPWWRRCC